MVDYKDSPNDAPILSDETVDNPFPQLAETFRRAAESRLSDEFTDQEQAWFDGEVQRRLALRHSIKTAFDKKENPADLGDHLKRQGTRTYLVPQIEASNTEERLFLARSAEAIEEEVAKQLGEPIPKTIDELLLMFRKKADKAYAAYKPPLPTGAAIYWLEPGAQEKDWDRWHAGGSDMHRIAEPSDFAEIADLDHDHPVMHAGRLHRCLVDLEGAAKALTVDLFGLVKVAMEVQSVADTLYTVTVKRRESGLTEAEAAFRGDANRRGTGEGGVTASKAKIEEGKTNCSRVLKAAWPIRESNPDMRDKDLVEAVVESMKLYPATQQLSEKTVAKHIRTLKKLGQLAAKSKLPSS